MRVTVLRSPESPDRPPLRLAVGGQVTVGERDTHWPAFVFVTAPSGEGWVPARHLSGDSGIVVVENAYDTTELAVDAGEGVEVVERDEESGWFWCRNGSGAEGWVPVAVLHAVR